MKRSTHWMILTIYYTSQLLGLLAFSYKYDSGKLETNAFITVYSCIINVLMFSLVPVFFRIQWNFRHTHSPELHFKISICMCLMHLVSALIAIVLNWTKRKHFMATIRDFQHLRANFLKRFQISNKVQQYHERAIRSKFYLGLMTNVSMFIVSYNALRKIFATDSELIIMGLGILAVVLNITMAHYFFALLNINVLLAVVNEEIERILNISSMFFKLHRLGKIKVDTLTTACCKWADELDDLAVQHYKLQSIGERINQMYNLHGACIVLTLYMNNISVISMIYMILQHDELSQEYGVMITMVGIPISLIFFYKDLNIFVVNMLNFGHFVEKPASLLNNFQSWLPTLDERFEKSLKNFSIQLAIFPFQMKLLGLFHFNRSMAFATFGSTISNAIVLMQYDYKYSKQLNIKVK